MRDTFAGCNVIHEGTKFVLVDGETADNRKWLVINKLDGEVWGSGIFSQLKKLTNYMWTLDNEGYEMYV